MRIIALITVILLIAFIPQMSHGTFKTASQPDNNYYNFSALAAGTEPQPSSAFGFSSIGVQSNFNTSVVSGAGLNGLGIRAQHYGQWSFLNITVNSSSTPENISATFSWNNALSAGLTENYIILVDGPDTLLNLSFGPYSGYRTEINNASGSVIMGPEPGMNSIYTLNLYAPANSQSVYYRIYNSTAGSGIPFAYQNSFTVGDGSISMLLGGEYTNFTLYNISESSSIPSIIMRAGNYSSYRVHNATLQYNAGSFSNYGGQSLIIRRTNTVFYFNSSGDLYAYNYYDLNRTLLYQSANSSSVQWASGSSSSGNAYFELSEAGTGGFIFLNYDAITQSLRSYRVNHTLPSKFFTVSSGSTVLVFGEHGDIMSFNAFNPTSVTSRNISASFGNSTLQLADSYFSSGLLYIQYYEPGSSSALSLSISPASLSLSGSSSLALNTYTNLLKSPSYAVQASTVSSTFSYSAENSMLLFSQGKEMLMPVRSGSVFVSSEGGILAAFRGYYMHMSANGTFSSTNLAGSVGESVAFNGSYGVFISGSIVTVFNSTGSDAYSGDSVSISSGASYTLTGNGYIGLNVSSVLPYVVNANISGHHYLVNGSSAFMVNSSAFRNGEYMLHAIAENTAGYRSETASTVLVDNGIPAMGISLGNNSYVDNLTVVNYSLNWSIGIKSIVVQYLNSTYSISAPSGSFVLNTGNYSGGFSLKYTVTDSYNRIFVFNYSETAVWSNPNGLKLNLWNGEYINTTVVGLKWSAVRYASSYTLSVSGTSGSYNLTATSNSSTVNMGNGGHLITVSALLPGKITERVGSANVTVIDYAPSISVRTGGDSAYSFYGNSANSTVFYDIRSNITAEISTEVFAPSGLEILNVNSYGAYNFSANGTVLNMSENGKYSVVVRATGLSRLASVEKYCFSVNNAVPAAPIANGTVLYTNRSYVEIRALDRPGFLLWADSNGSELSYSYYPGNGRINMTSGTGPYNFRVEARSDSGNTNVSFFTVNYFDRLPEISFSSVGKTLTNSSYENISMAILDRVPISEASLSIDNRSAANISANYSRAIMLHFGSNGNNTISVYARDLCGNWNRTEFHVNVYYYPQLNSSSIKATDLFFIQLASASLKGINTGSMDTQWYVNGKPVSGSSLGMRSLPFGFDNVTLTIHYGNSSRSIHTVMFSTGPFLPPAAALAIASILLYRRFSGSGDEDSIREFLSRCSGMKARAILKLSRREKLKRDSVEAIMQKLVDEQKAEIGLDPDGNRFFRNK